MLHVIHSREDQHHVFEVRAAATTVIIHTWGPRMANVEWSRHEEKVDKQRPGAC
jgi:hypothetical protein